MRTLGVIPLSLSLLSIHANGTAAESSSGAAATMRQGKREQLAADTPLRTLDGATFVGPRDWWIETRTNAIILSPEGDSRLAIVDVRAKDADSAVKIAWTALTPNLKWALKLAIDSPGREGWDGFRN